MKEWEDAQDPESDYEVIRGNLYSLRRPYRFAADYPRLVAPKSVRERLMKEAHSEVGHMAITKTLRKLQEAYVWPGMRTDVKDFVRKCPTCVTHGSRAVRLPMGELPLPRAPMQIVAADLIGPFVTSPEGNTYILTMIDHCTGWTEGYAIARKTSEEVWKKLRREFFPRHGYMEVLITDRGLEFGAAALRQYLKQVGVDHRRTTPYNPQCNGKVERLNRTLKGMLTKLINNNRDDWEDQLGPALMAYNNATSTVTGHTPFFLHYGRRARLPLSRMMVDHGDPLTGRLQDLSEALDKARVHTEESRKYNRERLARRANAQELKVGDSVVVKAQEPLTLTSKWDPQWTVTQIRGKVVWVRHQPSGKKKVLNRNKVVLVDPDIAWDELRDRPVRRAGIDSRTTGLRERPSADNLSPSNKRPAHVPMQTSGRSDAWPSHDVRPVLEDMEVDRVKRVRRRSNDTDELPAKRARLFLPRAAKRPTDSVPSQEVQKRARIDAIECVRQACA